MATQLQCKLYSVIFWLNKLHFSGIVNKLVQKLLVKKNRWQSAKCFKMRNDTVEY